MHLVEYREAVSEGVLFFMITIRNFCIPLLLSLLLTSLPAGSASAESIEMLVSRLGNANEDARTEAARELLRMKTPEAAYALADFMDYTFMDWNLKIEIMKLLADIRLPRAVKSLATVLETEKCPALKWHAARGLGKFPGNERAVAALMEKFPDEDEPQVREGIVLSLGELRDKRAVALLTSLLRDESFAVRHAAAQALGAIGASDALPALRQALQTEKDVVARQALSNAIRSIESGAAPI
jgi:HEAT repeat protein